MSNASLTGNDEIVDGKYRLGNVVSRSGRGTVFETDSGAENRAVVIKVRESDANEGEDPIKQARCAMDLSHPNLLEIYSVGSSILNDVPVTWAVMERADESLEAVLSTRPLTAGETRQILMSTAEALRYLHEKGYAHSRLQPSNVLAVGEEVKLSSDSVTRMSDGGSAGEDMWALGALIVQALTQQRPNGDGDSSVDAPAEMPAPFREIAQHCLDRDPATRWTAAQVLARLAIPEIVPPLPAHQLHMAAIPAAVPPANTLHNEEIHDEKTSHNGSSTRRIPNWIYAALAALLLAVILVATLRKKDQLAPAAVPATVTEQVPPAEVPPPPVDPPTAVAGATEGKATGWSVIAAAYASREPAEKRMREMAKRWPRFNPSVFQPHLGKTHYVVVLGQNLSEDEAEALRKRAVAAGLPRDTYIKKLI